MSFCTHNVLLLFVDLRPVLGQLGLGRSLASGRRLLGGLGGLGEGGNGCAALGGQGLQSGESK